MAVRPNLPAAPVAGSNEKRRADALGRKISRQDKWRTQVWAECELRIREMQAARVELGEAPIEIEEIAFSAIPEDELRALTKAGSED